MKRFSKVLVLILVLSMALSSFAFAATTLELNNEELDLNLMVKDGRTYVDRMSLTELGFKTIFTGKTLTLTREGLTMTFTMDSSNVDVNDITLSLDSTPFIDKTEAYVPLRFVLETIGYSVGWDEMNGRIQAQGSAADKFPVYFYHGDKVYKIDEEPTRIVSMAPSVTEILFAIGAGDKVVGRTTYCDYPAQVKDIDVVGSLYEPDLEKLLDLEPNLVIAATHMNQDIMNMLETAEIPALTQATPGKVYEIYSFIEKLGAVTGNNYEARALVSTLKAKQQRVNVFAAKQTVKPSVYYVVGTGQYGEYTAGDGTFINDVLMMSGANNVANDVAGWKYSIEKLIDHNPEYLLGNAFSKSTMEASDSYASLEALKDGKYVIVNENVFNRPGPRVIEEGLKELLKIFYGNTEGLGY